MDQSQLKWVTDFVWNIADDRLRDVYVPGKYRDQIQTMVEANLLALEQQTEGLLHKIIGGTA